MLQRTIVFPRWVCWCDQDWYASVLEKCRMGSSDLATPFACPSDVYFMTSTLDQKLDYRVAAFLDSPRVRSSNESSLD